MTVTRTSQPLDARHNRALGLLFIIVGVAIFLLFIMGTEPGLSATFGLNPGRVSAAAKIADLTLPVLPTLYTAAIASVFLGFFQFARGFRRARGLVLGIVSFFVVTAFLTWAARGKGLNLLGILETTLQRATPISLAALSGVLCERSGIVNIAIEGMMLTAACCSAVVGSVTDSSFLAIVTSMLLSGALGGLLALLSIRYKVNQVISGTAINILSTGATSFVSAKYLQVYQELNSPSKLPNIPIPGLSRIPILGPVFFENNLIVYLMLALLVIVHAMLYYTPWGLRTRAVGEHPRAADTLGINVYAVRYINTILGGMVAGLGGVFLVLGSVPRFDELMTAGKGFIGLAALIFGKWNPFGAFGASLIFGFTDTFQAKLQILQVPIPTQFMRAAPYIITMVVLAGLVGRSRAPAAEGEPYEKQ